MAKIDYYFSTLSPFAYLAGLELEKVAKKHGAEIHYKPLDIMALYGRTGGTMPKDRHPNRLDYRAQELTRVSAHRGLPMVLQPMYFPPNQAPASYAIIAAQKAGGGDIGGLVHGLMAALWAHDKNPADDEVIKACLSEHGFDPGLADSGLLLGAEVYAQNLEDGVAAGVFGSPFYITEDDHRFWGQDRLDYLDRHLAAM